MDITPEVIEAVRILRLRRLDVPAVVQRAVDTLDNAGLFAAVDQESGHDIEGSDAATRPLQVGDRIRHRTVRDAEGFGLSGTVGAVPYAGPELARVKWDDGQVTTEELSAEGRTWDKLA